MNTINMPGFTAGASVYKTSKHYFTGKTLINAATTMELVPVQLARMISSGSLSYTCDTTTGKCTCVGAGDCFDMGAGSDCYDFTTVCDGATCTCDWVGHRGLTGLPTGPLVIL